MSTISSEKISDSNHLFSRSISILADEKKVDTRSGLELVSSLPLVISNSPAMLALARSVYTPGKTYRMRTVRVATLSASGAGTMNLATSIAPVGMASYAALALLFFECRLKSTRIQYTMLTPATAPVAMLSAFDPTSDGSAPSSITIVSQVVGSKLINTWNTVGTKVANSYKVRGNRPWSRTTASPVGVDPVGGILGAWYHTLISPVTASVAVATYLIECDYELRNPF